MAGFPTDGGGGETATTGIYGECSRRGGQGEVANFICVLFEENERGTRCVINERCVSGAKVYVEVSRSGL